MTRRGVYTTTSERADGEWASEIRVCRWDGDHHPGGRRGAMASPVPPGAQGRYPEKMLGALGGWRWRVGAVFEDDREHPDE